MVPEPGDGCACGFCFSIYGCTCCDYDGERYSLSNSIGNAREPGDDAVVVAKSAGDECCGFAGWRDKTDSRAGAVQAVELAGG